MHVLSTLNIFGQQDPEFDVFKLIVPILIAVFWVVAQILSSIGKKKPKSPPAEAEYPVSLPPEAPMPQRQPRQQRQVKHRVETHQRQRAQRSAPPPLQRVQQSPPRGVSTPVPAATADSTAPVSETEVGTRQASQRKGSSASRLLRATLRPENLKKQFILTEILQPPVGIRNDRV